MNMCMSINEFMKFHRERSQGLSVFEVLVPDSTVTSNEIEEVEKQMNCKLPISYKDFCMVYGGGYFGFVIIFSMDKLGEWFILDKIKESNYYLPKNYLPFSDDQAGGLYCFKIENNIVIDEIYYIDSWGGVVKSKEKDFYNFLILNAYSS